MARILIVDDDQNLTHVTRTALAQKGYEVAVCHSTGKAIDQIKRMKPDLILMDIMMPEVSGPEAVRNFQKDPDFKNIPIIFLTGLISSDEEDLEETGINIDGTVYQTLGKPYEIDDLLKTVRDNLAKPLR
ncbi:MAG: response regulator [Candidatus Omnitrophica bacterium]|nr:response regulator [Candidatus Omnitrophota bacterium]MDE2009258.1 response regulator [Candidatus Omnitrophota bacterium]MDE2213778.1 response regulator [Candidatus Omnitrophota bacterium]MDE2230646.1 response regulator [Candidatus Omnitrophota bacterium]